MKRYPHNEKLRSMYMKVSIKISKMLSISLVVFTLLQLVMLTGCATQQLIVVPYRNHNIVVLSAKDVVAKLVKWGKSNKE